MKNRFKFLSIIWLFFAGLVTPQASKAESKNVKSFTDRVNNVRQSVKAGQELRADHTIKSGMPNNIAGDNDQWGNWGNGGNWNNWSNWANWNNWANWGNWGNF